MTTLAPRTTPRVWKFGIFVVVAALAGGAYFSRDAIGTRGQAGVGILCFLGFAALASKNLRGVNPKTLGMGILLQFGLAMAVLHVEFVQDGFTIVGNGIKKLVECSDKGGIFVFGNIAIPGDMYSLFPGKDAQGEDRFHFPFAFKALPPIIFISSFFTVLYYLGVLQFLVRLFARVMQYIMGTSGAETLSVAANVFMGQTEAPLIVRPFVPRMTQSELLALMASGMAHVSGGMMALYISYGADPVAILCTCVMACPCSLYLTKLVLPETEVPETLGDTPIHVTVPHANVIDAAASGIKDGLVLALNVAAMLIGFLAFIALFDLLIGGIKPLMISMGIAADALTWWPDNLKLEMIFGWLFSPLAFLMGVDTGECPKVGSLLGIKLAANEHVAYLRLTKSPEYADLSLRARTLAVYALTGFANFASVGIQLGGIGAMAEGRKSDLAKLGMRALFIGFLATILNAAVAGLLM